MQNVAMEVKGTKLTIIVDLAQSIGISKSGKSTNVATTAGSVPVPGHPAVKIGLNVFKPVGSA